MALIPKSLIALPVVLNVLMIGAVSCDMYHWRTVQDGSIRAFQRMVGGLGMGAVGTPLNNFIDYDPRIQPVDDSIAWPIPGIYSCSADRSSSVSYFEEMPSNQLVRREKAESYPNLNTKDAASQTYKERQNRKAP